MPDIFNNHHIVIEGWYWVLRSNQARRGHVKGVNLMGRELVIYRGEDGKVVALDAYCPHMGAHLAGGRVEGNAIRCLFHYWKYDAQGQCIDIPSLGGCQSFQVKTKTWIVEEQYGLIWIWVGERPRHPIPCVPELEHQSYRYRLGNRFTKRCHPHVVLINAIDEHHFNSVHDLPVFLAMEPKEISNSCIQFSNTSTIEPTSAFKRILRRFYSGPLTYSMTYWNGGTGAVTLGPDRLHFYIMFALRATEEGRTEGQTIFLTRRRRGVLGYCFDRVLLFLTRLVSNYFAKGDTLIFSAIRFNLKTPIKADRVILKFIQHIENQQTVAWRDDGGNGKVAPIIPDSVSDALYR